MLQRRIRNIMFQFISIETYAKDILKFMNNTLKSYQFDRDEYVYNEIKVVISLIHNYLH